MGKNKIGRSVALIVLSVLVMSCIGYCVPPENVRQRQSNELDEVIGEVELIMPAERDAALYELSPDGRNMLVHIRHNGMVLLDMVRGTETVIEADCGLGGQDMRWLNKNQALIRSGPDCYLLIDARDLSVTRVPILPKEQYLKPGGFQEVEPLLRKAERVYALRVFVVGDYTVIALDRDFKYIIFLSHYEFGITNEELDVLLEEIPHELVPPWTMERKLYSPDGEFYAWTMNGLEIYSRDGELVAAAYKKGWDFYTLGWAHDSSGVYFKISIEGSDAAVHYPYAPLFKLSATGQ